MGARRLLGTLGDMKPARIATVGAIAVAAFCAGWALLAWNTGLGGELFMQPGSLIADLVLPVATPGEPFEAKSAKSLAEGSAQLVVARGLERGLQVWWCAVAFWLALVPMLTFVGIFAARRNVA